MKFVDALAELIEKHFGGSAQELPTVEVEVTKSLDEEDRKALFVVLEPDVVDLHGDTYTAVEVEKACDNYNEHCRVANLFHRKQLLFSRLSHLQRSHWITVLKYRKVLGYSGGTSLKLKLVKLSGRMLNQVKSMGFPLVP